MRQAFSLLELMIVVVIIALLYTLSLSKLQDVGTKTKKPDLKHLKEYLGTYLDVDTHKARLLCLDGCEECYVLVDGEKKKRIESFVDNTIERYRYTPNEGAVMIENELYFTPDGVDHSVCFSYQINKEGVGDQIFVLYKNKAYDFTTYFTPTQVHNSLDELIQTKEQLIQKVMQ